MDRPAGIGPAERLTEDVVEVVNEIEHASLEILERGKACALEQSSREDREPDLDLVDPRAVSWGVDEAAPMRGILQERAARLLRIKDTGLAFDAEIFLNAATPDHTPRSTTRSCRDAPLQRAPFYAFVLSVRLLDGIGRFRCLSCTSFI